jgi:hypothetical protein
MREDPCDEFGAAAATPILDDFSYDGEPSSGWSGQDVASFTVQDGRLTSREQGAALYWGTPFGPDQEVYVDILDFEQSVYNRLALMLKSPTPGVCNLLLIQYDPGSLTIQLCVDEQYHSLNDLTLAVAPKNLRARAFANGCVDVYVDGELALSADASAVLEGGSPVPWLASGGYVGIYNESSDAAPAQWDDFGGGDL